ncbi:unnamed protein product, partial [Effrenium voratum]
QKRQPQPSHTPARASQRADTLSCTSPMPRGKAPPPPKAAGKSPAKVVDRRLSFDVIRQWRTTGGSNNLTCLDWTSIDSLVYASGGSGGVVLVRFQGESQICCVKPQRLEAKGELLFGSRALARNAQLGLALTYSANCASSVDPVDRAGVLRSIRCASLLADALDVATARLRILPVTPELVEAFRNAKLEIEDHRVHMEKKILADAKHLGILEFVHGPTMEGQDFVDIFQGQGQDWLEQFWIEAGRLTAFDCLINNLDRLPIIWDNDGNLKNLMVEVSETGMPRVVGIDQAVRGISSEPGLAKYVQSVRELVRATGNTGWPQSRYVRRLEQVVQDNFQGKFTVHVQGLQRGLQQGFRRFAWQWSSQMLGNHIEEALTEVAAVFDCTAAELWLLRRQLQDSASAVAEEVEKMEMHQVPPPILATFRKLLPLGHLTKDQLAKLLHELDPQCSMLADIFLEHFQEDRIDCSDFLLFLAGPGERSQ